MWDHVVSGGRQRLGHVIRQPLGGVTSGVKHLDQRNTVKATPTHAV